MCKALDMLITLIIMLSSTTASIFLEILFFGKSINMVTTAVDVTLPLCASLACGMCRTASKA